MKTINQKSVEEFFERAAEKISGDWVLVGGSILPSLGREIRATVDIDLAGYSLRGSEKQLELMEIAESMDLPVDAINTAAEFFLRKIKGFEKNLVPLFSKKDFKVYRPNVNLFIELKLPRLSESDLEDCREFLRFAQENDEEVEATRLKKLIKAEMKKGDERLKRLDSLLSQI